MAYYRWSPYVPVAERRRRAHNKIARLGRDVSPVHVEGRKIARSFWGVAWCENLESYSDYANRLPRGRTYVRNGSVMDLQVRRGDVEALVCGSELYTVKVRVKAPAAPLWRDLVSTCAGRVDSAVDLLEGKLSDAVMKPLARRGNGLFPEPRDISLDCSCPDSARMCKHVCAVLYGIGARLDETPELLFTLRGVDHLELITAAGKQGALGGLRGDSEAVVLGDDDLGGVFGIDIDDAASGGEEGGGRPARSGERKSARRTSKKARGGSRSTGRRGGPKRSGAKKRTSAKKRTGAKKHTERKTAAGAGRPGGKRTKTKTRARATRKSKSVAVRKGTLLTSKDLIALGVPRTTFQNWFGMGVLERTDETGVYRATRETAARVDRVRERRARNTRGA